MKTKAQLSHNYSSNAQTNHNREHGKKRMNIHVISVDKKRELELSHELKKVFLKERFF